MWGLYMHGLGRVVAAFLLFLATAPALAETVDRQVCGSGPNQAVCLGRVDAPAKFRGSVEAGGQMAIDTIMDDGLLAEVQAFKDRHGASGRHATAWRNVDAKASILAMRENLSGISVTTYGGFIPWLKYLFAGNLAYEPRGDGAVRLNRAGLPRTPGSIANTIAHELAHKVGLSHPSSDFDFATALCEPPYVIGSLVERRIDGARWDPRGHCPLLGSTP